MFHTRDSCLCTGRIRCPLRQRVLFLGLCRIAVPQVVRAVDVLPEEMAEARRWVKAKFEGVSEMQRLATGLNVLASYGPAGRNAHGELPVHWAARGAYAAEPPFSFTHDGKPSADLLKTWPK